jgi:hypothetical protein
MKTKRIAMLLAGGMLAGSSLFAGPRVFVGLNFGVPVVPVPAYAAPAYVAPAPVAYAAPYPGPGYVWVNGYYGYVGPRRVWTAGYWRAPVFEHRVFVRGGFGFRR